MKRPKTGGRKKGTPNKRTVALRKLLDDLNFEPAAELVKELQKPSSAPLVVKVLPEISPKGRLKKKKYVLPDHDAAFDKERAKILRDLMDFVYPRRKPAEDKPEEPPPGNGPAGKDPMEKLTSEELKKIAEGK